MNLLQQRKRRLSFLLIAAVAVSVMGYKLWRSRSPLARAEWVAAAPADASSETLEPFAWMSPDRLLCFHGEPKNWYPYTLDVRTGQRQRLEPLHTLILNQHCQVPFWVRWQVSPDGKWLLWGSNDRTGPSEYFVAALDGSKIIVWRNQPRQNFCQLVWLADSQSWLLLYRDPHNPSDGSLDHVRIFSLDNRHIPQTISLKGLQVEGDLVGCLPGNRLMTCDGNRKRFSVFALDAPTKTLKRYSIQADISGYSVQVLLSPSGNRLAWCITQLLHGRSTAIQASITGKNTNVRLLVSGQDGSHMRELGSFNAYLASHGGEVYSLCAWSSDEKRLLLLQNYAFWWLPAGN